MRLVPLSALGVGAAACTAALLLACGGKDSNPAPELPSVTERAQSSQTAPAKSATPEPSPSATPTIDTAKEQQAVIDAATAAIGARYVSPLTLQACLEENPDRKPCIELKSDPSQLGGGLARFALGDPDGGGATFLMGRTSSGGWGYWRGTQQQSYILDDLPGKLLACGKSQDAAIRVEPSANGGILRSVPDLTELDASEFVLTTPGQYGVQGERGQGWYHLTAPVAGWIDASETTDASLGDCLLHDAVEQVDRG